MGNPASSGCAPVQPPMPLPQGSGRHRQSLSISSLPLDKLGRINCEKRTSVSALSSPAKVTEKLSIATFLGHGQGKHRDFSRRTEELYLSKGMELATDDRKPMRFNPFRGHRRVGSGSFTTPCKVYSPRARSGSASTSSPKKLDKYAALSFDSPAKLERSMSMSRVAAHRPVAMKGNHGPYQPTNLDLSPSQLTQSGEGKRSSSSDSDLAVDMVQEPSSQQASPTAQIIDTTKMLAEGEAEQPPTIGVEDSPSMELEPHAVDGAASTPEDVLLSPSSSQSSMMTSMASTESESSLSLESPEHNAAGSEDTTIEEENSTSIAVDDNSQLLTLATGETKSAARCSSLEDGAAAISTEDESLVPFPSTGAREENVQVPEPRLTVRKRRRSVSASGLGAMLLKVVRVSDSAQIVARRRPKAGSPELILSGVEGLRARKYVLEKTAQIISTGPTTHSESSASISSANSTPVHHVCQPVSEDAIKSTYSTFVDIEIDPGRDCIELVQHSKDATQNGSAAATFETRQRNHQATPGSGPRHLQHDQESSCTGMRNDKVDTQTNKHSAFASSTTHTADDRHGGRRTREPMTSRARISSSDLDSLKECLKTGRIADSENETQTANQVLRVSRLQAPSCGASSRVDVFRPVSVLANPLFSSSHQDKLWEEQADIFSSGGRGTPGREDDATMANVMISFRRSPSPAFPCEAHQAPMGESPGTKRGRPPRSVADDPRRRGSPVFIRQIMSRIRGSSSPRASQPHDFAMESKRRSTSTWSSCICFSVK